MRLAVQMGYHRDPTSRGDISIFHGEMRRHVWTVVHQLDLFNCFQMGLPGALQSLHSDVVRPKNLQDTDFDEVTTELPPSRPELESTQILYFLVKTRIMDIFEKVLEYQSSFSSDATYGTERLFLEPQQAHDSVPLCLKLRSMAQSFADAPDVIMMRVNIELLYHKSICMLFRGNLAQSLPDAKSTVVCAQASVEMLRLQLALHQETKPGDQLCQDRWMVSSLSLSDFVLAAMILTLVLLKHPSTVDDVAYQDRLDLLDQSRAIFTALSPDSREGRRITDTLAAMSSRLAMQKTMFTDKQVDGIGMDYSLETLYDFTDLTSATANPMAATMESFFLTTNEFDWVRHLAPSLRVC